MGHLNYGATEGTINTMEPTGRRSSPTRLAGEGRGSFLAFQYLTAIPGVSVATSAACRHQVRNPQRKEGQGI